MHALRIKGELFLLALPRPSLRLLPVLLAVLCTMLGRPSVHPVRTHSLRADQPERATVEFKKEDD